MGLSIKYQKGRAHVTSEELILAGDVGATKTTLGIFQPLGKELKMVAEVTYASRDFADFTSLIRRFLTDKALPARMCFGVAGPVQKGMVTLTNRAWHISASQLSHDFGGVPVFLVNDLEAAAYGLALLKDEELYALQEGLGGATGNKALIAPGTGLGEAGLYWDGAAYHPFATEGGHSSFSPRSEQDWELYQFLQKKYGHVSWERVISGPGIVALYEFLRTEKEREEPPWLRDLFLAHDAATVISSQAGACPVCSETMKLFLRYLAEESASLVLKLKATGGLYIGGESCPK